MTILRRKKGKGFRSFSSRGRRIRSWVLNSTAMKKL
jgi:hypothetical protein